MDCDITSNIIKITPATYARAAISRLAARWWWVAVAPLFIFIIASFSDSAYIFAAFIWILLLLPPALMFAYYSYLLRPETAALSLPHHITINRDGNITITFAVNPKDENNAERADIKLQHNMLKAVIEKADYIELEYRDRSMPMLIIPFKAFQQSDISHVLARLYRN